MLPTLYSISIIRYLVRIARQNEVIANATRTVAETEEVGLEITSELARNREKIESSRAKVCFYCYWKKLLRSSTL